jgi:hypothetical protein
MFYNEDQEALEQRKKRIIQELKMENDLNADERHVKLRAQLEFARDKRLKHNSSIHQNKKVLLIASILLMLIYLIFK